MQWSDAPQLEDEDAEKQERRKKKKEKKEKKRKDASGHGESEEPAVSLDTSPAFRLFFLLIQVTLICIFIVSEKKKKRKREEDPTQPQNSKKDEKKKEKEHKKRRSEPTSGAGSTPSSSTATSSVLSPPVDTASPTVIEAYLAEHSITLTIPQGGAQVIPALSFAALQIPSVLQSAFAGFDKPTPIQACTWPPAIDGRDVVGIAETGR